MGDNYRDVRSKCRDALLVAVSKYKSVQDIQSVYDAGCRDFGENYVQEMVDKAGSVPQDLRWHFIGNLQSNKAKIVAKLDGLYMVHTVNSIKLADALNKALQRKLKVLVQINTSGEDSKSGCEPSELLKLVEHIIQECPQLEFRGLMTIGSPNQPQPNPDFVKLKELSEQVQSQFKLQDLDLSMGMSADYEHAIEMGSTIVRVGSQIFGARHLKP